MRSLVLQETKNLKLVADASPPAPADGEKSLKVLFCGICRTDARMWTAGHRDLALPRVLGHEISAWDKSQQSHCTIWPGIACGVCTFCRNGRNNLCQSIQIIGFHRNGGFAEYMVVPEKSIVYAPTLQHPELLCFAEPIGCVVNCLKGCFLQDNSRVIIYGGGVLGALAAMCCKRYGASVDVIEPNPDKIKKIQKFCQYFDISVSVDSGGGEYDLSINCCDHPGAFIKCLEKLGKGSQFRFFSGVRAQDGIAVEVINVIHYKELEVRGCYGPASDDMVSAVGIIKELEGSLPLLIEETVALDGTKDAFQHINSGMALKFIIDLGR